RRHTRFSRDWSSDVCSSDLYIQNCLKRFDRFGNRLLEHLLPDIKHWFGCLFLLRMFHLQFRTSCIKQILLQHIKKIVSFCFGVRSEERRVGKEGTSSCKTYS